MQIDPSDQLHDQQRKIRQLEERIHYIETLNHNLRQELNQMQHQKNKLQHRLDLDPISMLLGSGEDLESDSHLRPTYNDLQHRIQLYQEKIVTLETETKQYRAIIYRQDDQVITLKRNCERLSYNEQELIIENESLKKENVRLMESHQGWAKLVAEYEQNWKLLEKEILQAKTQLFENREQHHLELQKCHGKLQRLTNTWRNADNFLKMSDQQMRGENQHEKVNQLTDKLKKQSQIMQELGRQLDLRNDEIARYHSLQKANSFESKFEIYQHSLNQMIRDNNQRELNYTVLLQKYQKIAFDLKQSIKEKNHIQTQYQNLKKLYKSSQSMVEGNQKLHTELQNAKRKIQRQNQLLLQCDKNLNTVIEENDVFYEMMIEKYGMAVCQEKMNQHLEKYNQRKAQRQKQDQWANTQQLIQMNQKLMRKLRERQ